MKDQAHRTVITYVPHWRNAGTLSSSIHFTRHNHVIRPTSNCLPGEPTKVACPTSPLTAATSTAASSALFMVRVGPLPPGLIVMVSL